MAGLKVGIFGGTFDPPHLGHWLLANQALSSLSLDRLLWILTADPPHKRGRQITPLKYRLDMLLAAIQDEPRFQLSRVEIDRPAPHYAVDTIRILRDQMPGDQLLYLMGGDSLRDLITWHDPERLVQALDGLVVMRRPGAVFDLPEIEEKLVGISAKIIFLDTPPVGISSSEIRRLAQMGQSIEPYLQPAVYQVILKLNLY
jgi:nicotinate-nucleotide adenylyltransferase